MILAAGLGTRLRPLTADRPKALVEVAGHPLLEIAIRRLQLAGVRELIVNVHHFADQVVDFLRTRNFFAMRIEISRETDLLDTGGGLKQAAWFFREPNADSPQPFILHNVDVISTIDLKAMLALHQRNNSLATLAVQQRQTSRPLLFDEALHLCGRKNPASEQLDIVRQAENLRQWAFAGIHILSPQLLTMLPDAHAFPLIPAYLDAVAQGARIHGFDAGAYYWRDLGRPDSIAQAELDWDRLKIRETIEPASN